MPTKKRTRGTARPPKARSLEYMMGFHDALSNIASLALNGPIFLQVLATLAGKDIAIPGVDVHTRKQFEADFKRMNKKPAKRKGPVSQI